MNNPDPTVYIKANKHTVINRADVTLGDAASISCANEQILGDIKKLPLYKFPDKSTKSGPQMEFFTTLRVISLIHGKYPQAQVESIGEQDFIVEYRTDKPLPAWACHLKTALLCVVIFFGSAFTIMAFNNDISVTEIFTRFYEQVIGVEKPAVTELEISYSIGLAVGILVFFNHFGRRKFSVDPTPIQVEVNKFSSDCEDTLIDGAGQRGHEQDVS